MRAPALVAQLAPAVSVAVITAWLPSGLAAPATGSSAPAAPSAAVSAPAVAPAAPAPAKGGQQGEALPIAVDASEGIEWQPDAKIVYARGNARAVRGDLIVTADLLSAHYRELADGSPEVWKLDASGRVNITMPQETASGHTASYNLDNDTLIVHGDPARMTSGSDIITAKDQLQFNTRSRVLIARGDASAVQGDRQVKADEFTALLQRQPDGSSQVAHVDAERNVRVITPDEVLRGDRGTYDRAKALATLNGAVKITRGQNQLDGCRSETDLNTNISKLFACDSKGPGDSRARGLIFPGAKRGE